MCADSFKQWLIHIGKSEKTAKSYAMAVSGVISQWATEAGLIQSNLLDVSNPKQLKAINLEIEQLPIYQQRNTVGKGMYSAALKQFELFLEDVTGQAITEDIDQILRDTAISETEKSRLISTRIGQGSFRKQLIDYWQGCALTKCSNTQLLIASHIKPWSASDNQERLDPFNGLLLLPNLDKVFELGYITFEESGKIRISNQLEEGPLLGVVPSISVALTQKHQDYMEFHRTHKFECFKEKDSYL